MRPYKEWLFVQGKELGVVDSFCYLGDTIGAGSGCDLSVIIRVRSACAPSNFMCSFEHHPWTSIQYIYPPGLIVCQ